MKKNNFIKHNEDELGYTLYSNPNRFLGFWGNLCGMLATFMINQAVKYGDYYE